MYQSNLSLHASRMAASRIMAGWDRVETHSSVQFFVTCCGAIVLSACSSIFTMIHHVSQNQGHPHRGFLWSIKTYTAYTLSLASFAGNHPKLNAGICWNWNLQKKDQFPQNVLPLPASTACCDELRASTAKITKQPAKQMIPHIQTHIETVLVHNTTLHLHLSHHDSFARKQCYGEWCLTSFQHAITLCQPSCPRMYMVMTLLSGTKHVDQFTHHKHQAEVVSSPKWSNVFSALGHRHEWSHEAEASSNGERGKHATDQMKL